jgi:SPP1 family predicted phage head-tail adaptor
MLSSAQVTRLRSTAERALPDTCTIERRTKVSDSGGGSTTTWADHLTDVPCRLSPAGVAGRAGETIDGARISDETTHVVTLPAQTDVTEVDRLVISDKVYDITMVRERGEWEISRVCQCKEAP